VTALEDTRTGGSGKTARPAGKAEDEGMDGIESARSTVKTTEVAAARGDVDVAWVDSVRELERKEGGKLEVELRGYMSNLIKESIRVSSRARCCA
jgi:hypothetical protein